MVGTSDFTRSLRVVGRSPHKSAAPSMEVYALWASRYTQGKSLLMSDSIRESLFNNFLPSVE